MTAIQNVRYALRVFARNPGFTIAAVLCLMLGIGATTAIFSVVNAVVLRPLPYAHAARLVRVFTEFPTFPNGGLRHFWLSPPEYLELKREAKSYEDLEGWVNGGANFAGAAQPVRAQASFVTGGLLTMLGVQPLIGRQLTVADDAPNAPTTAVLSFGLWQRAYGGERSILGRDIQLDGRPCTVVGVMPPSFDFPPGETDAVELWTPLQIDPARPGGRGSHYLSILARLHEGVTLSQAQSEMTRYAAHSSATTAPANHPFDPKRHPLVLADFQDEVVKGVRPAMLVLLGAVGFVLLIACVNVANLLLARAEGRRREIAVRAAVGAGMGNLVRQFITEGVLLSFAGGALGTLLAIGGLRLLAATNAGSIPRAGEIDIDWQVLAFTLSISLLTGIAFGLAPLLHLKLGTLAETLKSAGGRNTGDSSAHVFRSALVTSELALALVLLIGTGLMVKAFWKLQQVDAGVRPDNVLTMRINLPQTAYGNVARVRNFWGSLLGSLGSLPGVVQASMTNGLPPNRRINANDTPIEGFVPVPNGPMQNVDYWNIVSPNYLDAVGARLIEGRTLTANDGIDAPAVVVINQTMARVFWPHGALGHRLRVGGADTPWRTVVGVIADIKNAGIDHPTGTELFVPYQQYPFAFATGYLAIHTQGDPMSMVNAVRAQVQALDQVAARVNRALARGYIERRSFPAAVPDDDPYLVLLALAGPRGFGNLWSDLVCGGATDERDRHPHGARRADWRCASHDRIDRAAACANRNRGGRDRRIRADSVYG